jgi:hypothetical protein
MTADLELLIRAAMTDLAEEVRPVNLTDKALRQAHRRRVAATTSGVAALTIAALGITPLVLAAGNTAAQSPAGGHYPCPSPPRPSPLPSDSSTWPSASPLDSSHPWNPSASPSPLDSSHPWDPSASPSLSSNGWPSPSPVDSSHPGNPSASPGGSGSGRASDYASVCGSAVPAPSGSTVVWPSGSASTSGQPSVSPSPSGSQPTPSASPSRSRR